MRLYVFLFYSIFTLFCRAQTMSIQGRLLDTKRNELPAATVRCYVNDTVYVKGTTTNGKGEFELKLPQNEQTYKLLFTYLGYKDLTLKINPTKEREVRLGEIVMNNDAVQMQEVTVLGENMVQTEEKMMVYPTKEQLRYTYDGYSAIDALMIPGLRLDIRTQLPTYLNQNILLCINGREATQEEIEDLNSKDIIRIDLYTNGKPDFPEVDYVLDFIIKKHDYAATIAATATQQVNAPRGNGRVTAQYSQGVSEWAVSARDNYNRLRYNYEGGENTIYHSPTEDIIEIKEYQPSENPQNKISTYINYIYKKEIHDFYASLRLNHQKASPDTWVRNFYNNNEVETLTQNMNEQQKNLSPALQLRYKHTLNHTQQLRLELYGSYGYNRYHNINEYRTEEGLIANSYTRSTRERSWYMHPKFNYTKTFKNKSSLNLVLDQDYIHVKDWNIRQEIPYEITTDNSITQLYATYNHRIQKRLSLQLQIAGNLSYTKTDGNTDVESDFIPSVRLSYLYKRHSLQVSFNMSNIEPSLSNRTGNEYQQNAFLYYQGNINLKNSLNYSGQVNYSWLASNRFSLISKFGFHYEVDPIYRDISYVSSRDVFVSQDKNGDKYFALSGNLNLQYALIDKILTIGIEGSYEYANTTLWQSITNNQIMGYAYANFQYKGWKVTAGLVTRNKRFNPDRGHIEWRPTFLRVNTSYSFSRCYIGFDMGAPFMHLKNENYVNKLDYVQRTTIGCPRIMDNVFNLTINYRFNFGKKKHKFDNSEVEDVNKSTIMK